MQLTVYLLKILYTVILYAPLSPERLADSPGHATRLDTFMLGGPVHDVTLHEVVEVTCRVPLASLEVIGLTEPDVTIRDSDEAAASAAQAPLPAVGGRVGEFALELPAARVARVAVAAVGKRGRLRAQAVARPSAGENCVPRPTLHTEETLPPPV